MPTMCVAYGCNNKGGHRFPKDISLKKKWVAAINRKNFTPSASSKICHLHFLPTDYRTEGYDSGHALQNRVLNKGAVPSVFCWKKPSSQTKGSSSRSKRKKAKDSHCHSPATTPTSDFPVTPEESEDANVPPDVCCEVEVISDSTGANEMSSTTPNVEHLPLTVHQPEGIRMKGNNPSVPVASAYCQTTSFCSVKPWVKLKRNPDIVSYYTGLESVDKLNVVLQSLGPAAYELNYRYNVENIEVEDQFLMALIKLRRALPDFSLAFMFDVSCETVQHLFVTWINFMYHEWSRVDIWPSKCLVKYYMPEQFKHTCPGTRVCLDAAEFPIQVPHPSFQQATFSTYKNRTTLKNVVGTTPGGLISYCSPSYGGNVSDGVIVERSDLATKCHHPDDSVMADRAFDVQGFFSTFLNGKTKLPGVTLLKNRRRERKRVHLDRILGLVETYTILKSELPVQYVPLGSEIFFVCCMLCNFQENFVESLS